MIEITAIQKAHKRQVQPSAITLRGVELEGFTRFYIDVNITADTMREWPAQRITDFFNGVAKVIRARAGF